MSKWTEALAAKGIDCKSWNRKGFERVPADVWEGLAQPTPYTDNISDWYVTVTAAYGDGPTNANGYTEPGGTFSQTFVRYSSAPIQVKYEGEDNYTKLEQMVTLADNEVEVRLNSIPCDVLMPCRSVTKLEQYDYGNAFYTINTWEDDIYYLTSSNVTYREVRISSYNALSTLIRFTISHTDNGDDSGGDGGTGGGGENTGGDFTTDPPEVEQSGGDGGTGGGGENTGGDFTTDPPLVEKDPFL